MPFDPIKGFITRASGVTVHRADCRNVLRYGESDRERLIVNYSYKGIAFEIRLSDGEVLREFRSLHDVSGVDGLAEERHEKAAVFLRLATLKK